jgi:hypothetical protein
VLAEETIANVNVFAALVELGILIQLNSRLFVDVGVHGDSIRMNTCVEVVDGGFGNKVTP